MRDEYHRVDGVYLFRYGHVVAWPRADVGGGEKRPLAVVHLSCTKESGMSQVWPDTCLGFRPYP